MVACFISLCVFCFCAFQCPYLPHFPPLPFLPHDHAPCPASVKHAFPYRSYIPAPYRSAFINHVYSALIALGIPEHLCRSMSASVKFCALVVCVHRAWVFFMGWDPFNRCSSSDAREIQEEQGVGMGSMSSEWGSTFQKPGALMLLAHHNR